MASGGNILLPLYNVFIKRFLASRLLIRISFKFRLNFTCLEFFERDDFGLSHCFFEFRGERAKRVENNPCVAGIQH